MASSLDVAKEIRDFLISIRKDDSLNPNALYALNKDIKYIEKCVATLSGNNTDAINDLWSEVQYLSRFFGGDYANGSRQKILVNLMNQFHSALLDNIVILRRKP